MQQEVSREITRRCGLLLLMRKRMNCVSIDCWIAANAGDVLFVRWSFA